MNYPKTELAFAPHTFEFVGPDPFYHTDLVRNLQALKRKQMAHLEKSPNYVAPLTTEVIRLAYKPFHLLLRSIFWTLTWVDGKFRDLADI